MVVFLERCDAFADFLDDACAFVSEDGGKESFGVSAGEGVCVGVADSCRFELDEHFACLRGRDGDRLDGEGFLSSVSNGGAAGGGGHDDATFIVLLLCF